MHPPADVKLTPSAEQHWGHQFLIGAAAAVIFVPVSLYLGQTLGSLSNNLIGAAIPTLLCIGLIPPIAITVSMWLTGRREGGNRYRFWPSFFVNLLVNGVSLAIAAQFGLSVGVLPRVVLYTIVQAIIQPAGTTMLMREFPLGQEPRVVATHDPISPTVFVTPTTSWSF